MKPRTARHGDAHEQRDDLAACGRRRSSRAAKSRTACVEQRWPTDAHADEGERPPPDRRRAGSGVWWTRRSAVGLVDGAQLRRAKRIASGRQQEADAAPPRRSATRMAGSASSAAGLTCSGRPGTGKRAQMSCTSLGQLGQAPVVVAMREGAHDQLARPGASRRRRSRGSWSPACRRGCRRPCWAAAGRTGWRSC